jgi:hypothetical protein
MIPPRKAELVAWLGVTTRMFFMQVILMIVLSGYGRKSKTKYIAQ